MLAGHQCCFQALSQVDMRCHASVSERSSPCMAVLRNQPFDVQVDVILGSSNLGRHNIHNLHLRHCGEGRGCVPDEADKEGSGSHTIDYV